MNLDERDRSQTQIVKKKKKAVNFQDETEMKDHKEVERRRTVSRKSQDEVVDNDAETDQKARTNISRSHSLEDSQEDPEEQLLDDTEYGRKTAGAITSDEFYQKEMSIAFPFLKRFDVYTRTSRKSNRLSSQMEFGSRFSSRNSRRIAQERKQLKALQKQKTFAKSKQILNEEQHLGPQQGYGLGIISFHQFIVYSAILFLLLTLMHIPVFLTLLSYDKDYQNLGEGANSADDKSLLERVTLGNLGFSSSECMILPMAYTGHNIARLRCKSGIMTNLVDFGVTTKSEDQYKCRKQESDICAKHLLETGDLGIKDIFEKECKGKDSCVIQNYEKFVSRKGDAQEVFACLSPESRVFFQYSCEQTEKQIQSKMRDARKIVIIELVCISMVILFIYIVKNRTHVLARRYIKNHVQAMDYTMFFPITRRQLKTFDKEYYKPNDQYSRGEQLKGYILQHLSELTEHKVQNVDANHSLDQIGSIHDHNMQITRIDLVFDNNNLIKVLNKRGKAIMYEDATEVQKFEEILNDKSYKDRQYFCKVVGCFVTYERKDDVIQAYKGAKKKLPFLGKRIKIQQADQPYQYIWQNMAFTTRRRCMGFMCSMILLFLFLAVAFTIQFKMQKTVAYFDNYQKADCNVYQDSVAATNEERVKTASIFLIPGFTGVRFQREAFSTWNDFYEETTQVDMTRRYVNSTLSCFCEIEFSKKNFLILFTSYRADGLDQSPKQLNAYLDELKKNKQEDDVDEQYICTQFLIYSKLSSNYYILMSLVIFLFNLGLYELTAPILSITGFSRRSQQQNLVSIIIMICLLIDTILIPVMIGANFVEYGSRNILDQIFTGKNTDFGRDWYPDVGYGFVITMSLYICNPLFTILAEWADLRFRQCWRSRFNKKLKAKQDNEDLRYHLIDIGPVYVMDYKIASVTSLFFIAVVFGPLVPLLYPMGFIAILVQYYVEIVTLRKFYKLSEARKQDEKMTLINLKMLLVAPILGLAVSIWAFSNRQMFENKIDPVSGVGEVVLSHHLLTDKNYPNYPHVIMLKIGLLGAGGFVAFMILNQGFVDLVFRRKKFKNMPDYTDSLTVTRCEEIVEDEKFFRNVGGFSILPDQALKKLEKRLSGESSIDYSRVASTQASKVINQTNNSTLRVDELDEEDDDNISVKSESFFNSANDSSNKLIGQPSYQAFYDIEYLAHFNELDPDCQKAIKLLLILPMVQQDKIDKIQINHFQYGRKSELA